MRNLFFEFTYADIGKETFKLSSKSIIESPGVGYADKYISQVLSELSDDGRTMSIRFIRNIPDSIKTIVADLYKDDDEGYAIDVNGDSINIYADGMRGFIYAVSTLKQIIYAERLSELVIYDRPDKKIRGYRVYTPGVNNFDNFKKMVDKLVYYKYNCIDIEVGGAMEYDRHPEINEKWKEFCKEVSVSPEATHKIQMGFSWPKNSIHVDNGDRGVITKAQMRELVEYCKERGFEVIPEVPSLSHSDYIVMAHPDIREREDDPYPDTYCPLNPKSYEILFDIIDEVLEVFEPEKVNIGHDELYSIGLCEKCIEEDPVKLFVDDISKINDYLKSKGVSAIMWGDNMFYKQINGWHVGAWARPYCKIPDMGRCVGKIPKDITILNWHWSLYSFDKDGTEIDLGYEDEQGLVDKGYNLVFGNFASVVLRNYRKRMNIALGAFVSNWGSFEKEYMQRNRQDFDITSTAYALWSHNYDNDQKDMLLEKTRIEMQQQYYTSLGDNIIKIRHTTDFDKNQEVFYDGVFIIPEEWIIGYYIVTYDDGTVVKLPVNFYYNIGCKDYDANSNKVHKLYGAGTPVVIEDKTHYETAYENPYPDKQISNIRFEKAKDVEVEFQVL